MQALIELPQPSNDPTNEKVIIWLPQLMQLIIY